MGDFDSIHQDVKTFYEKKNVSILIKKDWENTDLDKCLYISLEKLSNVEENDLSPSNAKRYCFIILGASGGRIDHTISTYNHVYKYLSFYSEQLSETEIFIVSESSLSVFLKNGTNIVENSESIQNPAYGFSIMAIYGDANVRVTDDMEKEKETKGK